MTAAVPNSLPLQGGAVVTFVGTFLGNGSDISAVVLNGQALAPVAQTATSVSVLAPSAPISGPAAIAILSNSQGNSSAPALFVYFTRTCIEI